jgi:hypothetical protein
MEPREKSQVARERIDARRAARTEEEIKHDLQKQRHVYGTKIDRIHRLEMNDEWQPICYQKSEIISELKRIDTELNKLNGIEKPKRDWRSALPPSKF